MRINEVGRIPLTVTDDTGAFKDAASITAAAVVGGAITSDPVTVERVAIGKYEATIIPATLDCRFNLLSSISVVSSNGTTIDTGVLKGPYAVECSLDEALLTMQNARDSMLLATSGGEPEASIDNKLNTIIAAGPGAAAYDAIYCDDAGAVDGAGTPDDPIKYVDAASELASAQGLNRVIVVHNAAINANFTNVGLVVEGGSWEYSTVDFGTKMATGVTFKNLKITGLIGGSNAFERCYLDASASSASKFIECIIKSVTISGSTYQFINCSFTTALSGTSPGVIVYNASVESAFIHGGNGDLSIQSLTTAQTMTIKDFRGRITFHSSCSGTPGVSIIGGYGQIVNDGDISDPVPIGFIQDTESNVLSMSTNGMSINSQGVAAVSANQAVINSALVDINEAIASIAEGVNVSSWQGESPNTLIDGRVDAHTTGEIAGEVQLSATQPNLIDSGIAMQVTVDKVRKFLTNKQAIETDPESGDSFLVTYDDDNVNEIASQELQTFDGEPIGDLTGTTTPSIRLKADEPS